MKTVRAAAHVHSEWSYDAGWTLPALAAAFARRRYDVVLMSEHDRGFDERRWADYRRDCAEVGGDRVLLVPGIEYEDPDGVVHVPVWGEGLPFFGERRPTLDVLRAARSEGGFAVFAHPWRREATSRYLPEWSRLFGAVEVWNRQYDGIAPNPGGRAFAEQERLPPFVSLDFHSRRQFFPLAMLIDVEEPVTTASVAAALGGGRFRPDVLGMPALRLTEGAPARAAQAGEALRRRLRGPVRRVERALRR